MNDGNKYIWKWAMLIAVALLVTYWMFSYMYHVEPLEQDCTTPQDFPLCERAEPAELAPEPSMGMFVLGILLTIVISLGFIVLSYWASVTPAKETLQKKVERERQATHKRVTTPAKSEPEKKEEPAPEKKEAVEEKKEETPQPAEEPKAPGPSKEEKKPVAKKRKKKPKTPIDVVPDDDIGTVAKEEDA